MGTKKKPKAKVPFIRLNGNAKILGAAAGVIAIATLVWRAGAFCQGLTEGIKAGQEKDARQDSTIATLVKGQETLMQYVMRKNIEDSIKNAPDYVRAKQMADSLALWNAQHPGQ